MIINKNTCGIEFGEEEIIWQLDNEVVSYSEIADAVASKKAIKEITPKASEIAAIDNENVEYFMKLIDKAIAKRFGG